MDTLSEKPGRAGPKVVRAGHEWRRAPTPASPAESRFPVPVSTRFRLVVTTVSHIRAAEERVAVHAPPPVQTGKEPENRRGPRLPATGAGRNWFAEDPDNSPTAEVSTLRTSGGVKTNNGAGFSGPGAGTNLLSADPDGGVKPENEFSGPPAPPEAPRPLGVEDDDGRTPGKADGA